MFKNIIKSICWFAYYFVLQMVGMFGLFFFDLFSGRLTFSNLDDINVVMEELTTYLFSIAVPSLIVAAIIFVITFVFYKLIRKHSFDFKTVTANRAIYMVCLGFVLNVVITLLLNLIIGILPENFVNDLDSATSAALTGQPLWVLLLGTGILGPLLEELVFRYGICGTLARKNEKVALIASAIVFGIVHGNLIQGVYATVLGLIFGIIYLKYKNIWYPTLIHMAINSSSILVSVTEQTWIFVVCGVVGLIGLTILTKQNPEFKTLLKLEPVKTNVETENMDVYSDGRKDIL